MPDGFNNILNILNNPNQYQWDKLNKYTPNPQVPLIPLQKEIGKTIDGKNNYFINDNLQNQKLSTSLIGAKYYNDKPIIDENGVTVYAEETITLDGDELDEVTITAERIYKNKYSKPFENFELVVFIHTDGALILQQNEEVEAKSNQLVLFLEANNKSNYFGSVLRAKIGSDVKMDDLPFVDIFRFIEEGHPVNISNKEIKALITKSNLKNKGRFLIKVFNTILKPGNKLADFIFSRLANFAKDTIPDFFEKNLKIQENRWNPNVKDYSPLFMNRGLELIIQQQKRIKTKPVQYLKNVIKPIDEILDALDERINNCNDYIIKHLHRSIALRLVKAIRHVKKQLKDVKDFFSKSVDWLVEIIETGFETANAFICGIINSIIDAVSGLFQLVGWVCYAVAIYNKIKSDLVYSFSLLVEFVENILEAIFEFNLIGFIKDVILLPVRLTKGIIKLLKRLPDVDLGKLLEKIGSSLSNIAYVCGYIVGFIIQLVLEAFFTGGVKAAETMIAKIMAFLKNPIAGVGAGLRAVKEVGEDIFKAAFRKLSKFFEDLKTGKAATALKQWVNDILEAIKKELGISDEVLEETIIFDDVLTNLAKGGGDINKSFAENAGISFEGFVTEAKLIGQTTDHTCVATSLKMILEDIGITRSEDFLATAVKTDKNGASILDIPDALYNNRLDEQVIALAEEDIKFSKLLEKMEDGDKAIVSIFQKNLGNHAVVLEKIEDGRVFLRDPLPANHGASYSLILEDFTKIFNDKAVIIKK